MSREQTSIPIPFPVFIPLIFVTCIIAEVKSSVNKRQQIACDLSLLNERLCDTVHITFLLEYLPNLAQYIGNNHVMLN